MENRKTNNIDFKVSTEDNRKDSKYKVMCIESMYPKFREGVPADIYAMNPVELEFRYYFDESSPCERRFVEGTINTESCWYSGYDVSEAIRLAVASVTKTVPSYEPHIGDTLSLYEDDSIFNYSLMITGICPEDQTISWREYQYFIEDDLVVVC